MHVTVIADASWDPNLKVAGYGFWIKSARDGTPGQGGFKGTVESASTAEAMAIVNALVIGLKKDKIQSEDDVLLQTDCVAAIDLFENRRRNLNHQEAEVKKTFEKYVKDYKLRVTFRHVKGHSLRREARYTTNRLCDMRAKAEMRRLRENTLAQPFIDQIKRVLE